MTSTNITADKATSKKKVRRVETKQTAHTKKTKVSKTKQFSALDAAARVLAESSTPMSTQQIVEAMAVKNYWKSPAGKTPAATLYSAILREISAKGNLTRFIKTEPGKFSLNAAVQLKSGE